MNEASAILIYESVAAMERMANLNDLEVKSIDILNAYIQAPVAEKECTILGHEFGKDTCKTVVTIKALYGLKLTGAIFISH